MKTLTIILCSLFLAVSCGSRPGSTGTFKIISSSIIDPQTAFPGGVLVMGRHTDGSQHFIVPWTPTLELVLKKGAWDFATIGWEGSNPLEGTQKCAFAKAEVNADIFSVEFNMNKLNCLQGSASDGSRFTSPLFYRINAGGYEGFKKLIVKTCANLSSDCTTQVPPNYLRVIIPVSLEGVQAVSGLTKGLSSNCINATAADATELTPPHGGPRGFITTKIITFTYDGVNAISPCSNGNVKEYVFNHGFGKPLDQTQILADETAVTRRGALSVDAYSSDAQLALTPLVYKGEHSDPTAYPALFSQNDVFKYTGSYIPPMPSTGSYLWRNGTDWTTIHDSDYVKLILED